MAMNDDEIIRARLLVDERPLKRLIKRFYQISSCPIEELDTTYAQFILDLDSQSVLNATKSRISSTAASEIASYEAEIARIERETKESERSIEELKIQLLQAQQTRKNKIVYDEIAKEAMKLPSRAHSADNINRLTSELQTLEAEQKRYAETWSSRQEAFSSIVRSLEELGEKVREEKSEQERREALGDNDEDADEGGAKDKDALAGKSGGEGEESGAEDGSTEAKKRLDPAARSFEPSPLGQIPAINALDTASPLPPSTNPESNKTNLPDVVSEAAPAMDVDEDGEVVMELLDEEKRRAKEQEAKRTKKGDKRDRGDREEGEEEEGDGEDTEMKEG